MLQKKVFDESGYGDNNEHRPDLKIKERGNDFCILKNDDTNGANTSVGTSGMVFGTGDFAYFLTHFAQGWISQIHWINNKEQFLQAIQTSNMPEYDFL